nr:hypothetical protein [Tanacetum cinerariifolium]
EMKVADFLTVGFTRHMSRKSLDACKPLDCSQSPMTAPGVLPLCSCDVCEGVRLSRMARMSRTMAALDSVALPVAISFTNQVRGSRRTCEAADSELRR